MLIHKIHETCEKSVSFSPILNTICGFFIMITLQIDSNEFIVRRVCIILIIYRSNFIWQRILTTHFQTTYIYVIELQF